MVEPRFFDKIAPYYDFLTRFFMMGTYDSVRKKILCEDTRQFTVLDLCCGTGYISNKIDAQKIVGLDQSEHMLALNARVTKKNKILIKGNAYNMPFSEAEFDRIYCSTASHEFKKFSKVLDKCHQILKGDGKLILFDIYQPNNRLLSFIMNTFVRHMVERNLMWVYTKEQWARLLTEAGFRIEELKIIRGFYIFIRAAKESPGTL
jgi:demethylmenaquinone methyltransferase/2-methoxy-6-polyprenyl-1,4-benzoquinol methylase